jgi:indolepyruvate decarboxylase
MQIDSTALIAPGYYAGMGADGYAVSTRDGLADALHRAHSTRGRFQLIDIRIETGVISPTLQRFVAAVQRLSMPSQP